MIYQLERDNVIDYNYHPLVYDKKMVDLTGTVALPLGLLQDIEVIADADTATIVTIHRAGNTLALGIDTAGTVTTIVCTDGVTLTETTTVVVKVVLDNLANHLPVFMDGVTYDFGITIAPTRLRRYLGVHSVTPLPAGPVIDGDALTIKDGYNIATAIIGQQVVVNALVGAGEGLPCGELPEGVLSDCQTAAQSINGVTPDWYGDFKLEGGDNITVENLPEEHKIRIKTSVDGCTRC